MKINVLFLGGAKRVSMARLWWRAAKARDIELNLYSYEISTHVPICTEAKVIVGLRWDDPRIYDDLIAVVTKIQDGKLRCNIRRNLLFGDFTKEEVLAEGEKKERCIIVPFVDGAVSVAAEMARRYPDEVFAPTCSPAQAEEMFDKVKAATVFESLGLPVPPTYYGGEITTPLIAKPRHGSASKGLIEINSKADLEDINLEDYLTQQRIDRRDEYTVDCYASVRDGKILALVPRKRLEVSGGEVTRTETVIWPEVYDLAKHALTSLGLRGAVTIQIIHDKDTDRYMIMEINPRLGGGAVCTVYAGVDLPSLIMDDMLGKELEYQCYRPNTEIARYPQEVAFYN